MGRRIRGVVAAALVAAPLAALAPAAARADAPPITVSPEAVAQAQAESTGKPVTVTADNTDSSTTTANPDGSFTYSASPFPFQVNQGGSWVPVDATLQRNSDGSLSPKAAVSGVTFSAGGTAALATMTNLEGQQVSVSWPSALPAPTVSGATATYASVYPGVDLQMTATTDGGYTEHLVVQNSTAASNPALQDIHFNVTATSGLTVSKSAADGLQVTDSSGNPVFSSPTATMWSTANTSTSSSGSPSPSPSPTSTTTSTQSISTSSTDSLDDAHPVTDLGVNVSGSAVDLVPPAGSLTASGTTYPLVITPPWPRPSPAGPGSPRSTPTRATGRAPTTPTTPTHTSATTTGARTAPAAAPPSASPARCSPST